MNETILDRLKRRWEAEERRLDELKKSDRKRLRETPNQTRLDIAERHMEEYL